MTRTMTIRKFTDDECLSLLDQRQAGATVGDLAQEYGCSWAVIWGAIERALAIRPPTPDPTIEQAARPALVCVYCERPCTNPLVCGRRLRAEQQRSGGLLRRMR